MTPYEFGDILLLSFPFSDLTGGKKRPALVIADTGDQDLIVARITSDLPRDSYDLSLERWKEIGLLLPSTARLSKLASLNKKLVLRKLGKFGSPEKRKSRALLKRLLNF
jgi:mRNA interferase MazF